MPRASLRRVTSLPYSRFSFPLIALVSWWTVCISSDNFDRLTANLSLPTVSDDTSNDSLAGHYLPHWNKVSPNSTPGPRPRVVLCIFGVLPRSIKHTWRTLEQNILRPLESVSHDKTVPIHVFNIDVGNNTVDGVTVEKQDTDVVPYDVLEEARQSIIDAHIAERCKSIKCKFRYTDEGLHHLTENAFRQLYAEWRVANMLREDKYDLAVVTSSDFFFVRKLNVADVIHAAASNDPFVFTTAMNDAGGYTNGFYFGRPGALKKILNRYMDFHRYPQYSTYAYGDYEQVVKDSFSYHNISRGVTDIAFCKLRANEQFWVPPALQETKICSERLEMQENHARHQ